MIYKTYTRKKPHLWNRDNVHTCYDGHDCEERWTIGHHLAEALSLLEFRGIEGKTWDIKQVWEVMEEASHHIRKTWDKSR